MSCSVTSILRTHNMTVRGRWLQYTARMLTKIASVLSSWSDGDRRPAASGGHYYNGAAVPWVAAPDRVSLLPRQHRDGRHLRRGNIHLPNGHDHLPSRVGYLHDVIGVVYL